MPSLARYTYTTVGGTENEKLNIAMALSTPSNKRTQTEVEAVLLSLTVQNTIWIYTKFNTASSTLYQRSMYQNIKHHSEVITSHTTQPVAQSGTSFLQCCQTKFAA